MYCKKCGSLLDDDAVVCPNCGVPTDNYYASAAPIFKRTNGLGIAGFVISLLSIVLGYLYCIPSIIAFALSLAGHLNRKNCTNANGLALAGIIISVATFVFWLIILIIAAVIYFSSPTTPGTLPVY